MDSSRVGGGVTFLSHHENLKLSHTNKICDVKQILSSIFLLFLELASKIVFKPSTSHFIYLCFTASSTSTMNILRQRERDVEQRENVETLSYSQRRVQTGKAQSFKI